MNSADTIDIFKALADKTRLEIVRILVRDHNDKASCADISAQSKLSQSAMSHHFGRLVDTGILLESKDGTRSIYELNSKLLARVGIDPKKL